MNKKSILCILFLTIFSLITIEIVLLKKRLTVSDNISVVKDRLPVKNLPADLVKNSVIDSLFANADGYVSEKYDNYFILKSNNNSIKLYVEEEMNVTNFYRNNSSEKNHILYSDIKIGDHLAGGVSIVPNVFGAKEFVNRKVGDIIAHTMSVRP